MADLRGHRLQPHPRCRRPHRHRVGQARTATIRAVLINIPARIAYSARVHTLDLPAKSRRETLFNKMFDAVMAPPQAA